MPLTHPILSYPPILHRVFSMPLKDLLTDRVFGVIHVINKVGNDVFTASDEMLIKLFVHHLETTLSHCNVYTRTTSQLHLLESMVRSSIDLASTYISPENPVKPPLNPMQPNDILRYQKLAPKPLQAAEILHVLETVTHDALKLSKLRAFLVTSPFIDMTPGSLIYLTKSTCSGLTRHSSDLDVTTVPVGVGIAGRAASTAEWHEVDEGEPEDEAYHPDCDLDPAGAAMITVPIRLPGAFTEHSYPNGVVAVLQMIRSSFSPKIIPNEDDTDGICLSFATMWLTQVLTPPLLSLLGGVVPNPLVLVGPSFVVQTKQRSLSAHFIHTVHSGSAFSSPGVSFAVVAGGGPRHLASTSPPGSPMVIGNNSPFHASEKHAVLGFEAGLNLIVFII